jgi:PncC family amidohydrolase
VTDSREDFGAASSGPAEEGASLKEWEPQPSVVRDARQAVQALFESMLAEGKTLAAAESCSGGLFCALLTDFPGSSAVLLEGRVVYSNEAKRRLGVPAEILERFGAVSEETALALARAARDAAGADMALAVSGIAGPGGAVPGKPVGTVALAGVGPGALEWTSLEHFAGNRATVRFRSCERLAQKAQKALSRS